MAYNESRIAQVRDMLSHLPDVDERKMFGGVGFMVNGHLTVAVGPEGDRCIMVRLNKAESEEASQEPGASMAMMGNRRMVGWVDLSSDAIQDPGALTRWVQRAVDFVSTLPPK